MRFLLDSSLVTVICDLSSVVCDLSTRGVLLEFALQDGSQAMIASTVGPSSSTEELPAQFPEDGRGARRNHPLMGTIVLCDPMKALLSVLDCESASTAVA